MWVTSWYCKHHEYRLHVNLDSQGKIEPRHLAQTLCWCLWAFRVFFSLVVWGFFVSPSAHQKVLWNLFEHQMLGILYFPYNDWRQAKKFGGELCKAEPQCLHLVDAVLSTLQHYRKNDVNDVGEWMGWEGWQQQQGLCQSAVMQQCMPEPLHCPEVRIKNLQVISPGSPVHWLWSENQAPNFRHNPAHSVNHRKTISICLTRSEVLILWIVIPKVMRKGFVEGPTLYKSPLYQSDLAADQFSQGRRVKAGPN